MLLHGILPGPHRDGEAQAIYVWVSDKTAGQAPVSVQLDAALLSVATERTDTNDPVAADEAICDTSMSDHCILFNAKALAENLNTPTMCFIFH